MQQLGAWHRRKFELPLIGITGSNGKTTTREMMAAVLEKKYRVFQSEGNKNNHIGLPLMLLKLDRHAEVAVLELG
ncbi:MAG: UDP-N-acetylmuramoyl-tripeptide--D-alanyl-D-alanine ligase, partial [Calditrichaeota bacterium]|nr:UDP-N-acetylmuramoyl-tripeptide--D-alanyl-D-alanine ligase [Calditrichota bacterium]